MAFDFDGTITTRDSFTAFLRWRADPARYALGLARLAPAGVRYLFDKDRGRIKAAAATEFLRGLTAPELEADAESFAVETAPMLFRPDALATWRRWRAEGARLVIVSASPSFVVAPFAERLGADRLIATELAYDSDGRATGRFATPNCRGPEKVARLREAFGEDVTLRAAYGDTAGDREMLQIAEIQGFKIFQGRPEFG
ncbi:HAD-IB family hydrolase [Phenylobacterium soli]|uniref:HAD-IB family hydrolase n=1 Tax=Phenylobacterium soli TaxID=2170551 RepID=UPI0029C6CC90|nr:HAD-IB family hydrolase [Phenylobacterium soli]